MFERCSHIFRLSIQRTMSQCHMKSLGISQKEKNRLSRPVWCSSSSLLFSNDYFERHGQKSLKIYLNNSNVGKSRVRVILYGSWNWKGLWKLLLCLKIWRELMGCHLSPGLSDAVICPMDGGAGIFLFLVISPVF